MHTHDPFVTARYSPQRIPQFRGNPLIEALPPMMSDQQLLDALTLTPEFSEDQRQWANAERLMMLGSLQNFMFPLQNHLELGMALDRMIRNGYVGRAPRTPGHAQIFQKIYENQMTGVSFSQTATSRTPQISTSLVGISGMGKTTTVNRWCAHLPQVIYHPEFNLYQVPYLHVEMPSDGSSIKGLAHAILQKLDELIPGANYYKQHAKGGRTGADSLMRAVARVMNMHLVGLLICDEVQNLANSHKGSQIVMTELVSACNDLKVPILFIGTNKAAKVLGIDFRQSRRASGNGVSTWDRLYPKAVTAEGEWDEFLEILWQFQWVRNPAQLDPVFDHYMYDMSQGVIDIAIKLFASAQARAILDGSERLTPELLATTYQDEFTLLHPMMQALRTDNFEFLCEYDDIAPISLQQSIDNALRKLTLQKSPLFSVKASDNTFIPRLETGLTMLGFPSEESSSIAQSIAAKDPNITLGQGVKAAVATLTSPKPTRSSRSKKAPAELPMDRFDERPDDYRRAVAYADQKGVPVLDQLKELGMAPLLEEIIEI